MSHQEALDGNMFFYKDGKIQLLEASQPLRFNFRNEEVNGGYQSQ